MKHTSAPSVFRKGFTLIELLIVIALLGALAIGLLATIDPFEQLKKGRDTSARNTVSEFYNANLRYYAIKAQFPWGTNAYTSKLSDGTDQIQKLVDQGELKDKFVTLAGTGNLDKMFVTATDATHMAVCFKPESKSFQGDPNTIYNSAGSTAGMNGCKSGTSGLAGTDCFFCIQ